MVFVYIWVRFIKRDIRVLGKLTATVFSQHKFCLISVESFLNMNNDVWSDYWVTERQYIALN